MASGRRTIRLREVRRERGLSQRALGALIGVAPQVLSGLENERIRLSPTAQTIRRLSQALGVAAEDLLKPADQPRR